MTARSILITGCSSGIGLESARVMKARGWRVFATARKPADLERLKSAEGIEAIPLELADSSSIAACADQALALTNGQLFAVFNNAAYGQAGAVEDVPPEALARQLQVNVVGQHDLTCRLIPSMRKNGQGRIVQCSSILGLVAVPMRGSYCASKFALEGLTDSLRQELIGSGIRVSLIEPGPIASNFVANALANLKATIDLDASPHREKYLQRIKSMEAGGIDSSYKLGPEAVAAKLVHAVESSNPRRRYYVTKPTYYAAAMKRFVPPGVLEWFTRRN